MVILKWLPVGYRSSSSTHPQFMQFTISAVIKLDFKWATVLADTRELWKLGSLLFSVVAESQMLEHELTTLKTFSFSFVFSRQLSNCPFS